MRIAVIFVLFTMLTACAAPARIVDPETDSAPTTMGIDYRDFEKAATQSVRSMLRSRAVEHPGGRRYVMVVSRITNDTMQRIDTDQLIKKIRVELLKSGRVVTTTAVGLQGPEDEMSYKARELRGNEEFDQSGVAAKRRMQAPDLSLSGKLIQRNHRLDRRTQQTEYYFQLTLTEIETGLAIWEDEIQVVKRGTAKSVTWDN